ncbi:hypothetical protein SAMN02745229_00180 [Butyrivibrio fibrisolvens DSM 3071]|uniref:Uncharacterized protein n=1 Tax=Butyrivibrio fibrisolvens DSM 3071 TaxID=1121131 RepID=A0A1M5Q3B2_BUTFI|nr:hypothetical protein [Butyrivibrio fibrisolvens]SHH08406.1 hypothetical protein SAMN02745229_00180 [Butyrivibrio fibrisolvens DSM 3071]
MASNYNNSITNDNKIKVFLSRPNPFLTNQQKFIDIFREELLKHDIETITLVADDYDLTDSMNYLKGMIKQCYGMVIIGFKQIFIEKGYKKKGGTPNPNFFFPDEIDLSGQALTSPFCHIEGTMGLLNDLPLLIINEEGVREEGIIAGGKFCYKTDPFSLDNIDYFFKQKVIEKQISVWLGKVNENYLFLNLKKV